MLESEEGQRNAVFACYGSAAHHGQLLEESLRDLLLTLDRLLGQDSVLVSFLDGATTDKQPARYKRTIGQLISQLKERITPSDQQVFGVLEKALEERNFLIHRYFLERSNGFDTQSGRWEMLKELLSIEESIRRATSITGGIRVAITSRLDRKQEEPDISRVLFTVTIT